MPRAATLSNGCFLVAFDATGALRDLTFPMVGMENHAHGRSTRLAVVRGNDACVIGGPGAPVTFHATARAESIHFSATVPRLGLRLEVIGRVHPVLPILTLRVAVHPVHGAGLVRLRMLGSFEISESNALNGVEFLPRSRSLHFFRRKLHLLLTGSSNGRHGLDEYQCGHHALPVDGTPAGVLAHATPLAGSTASVGDVEAVGGVELDLDAGVHEVEFRISAAASLDEALAFSDADMPCGAARATPEAADCATPHASAALADDSARSLTLCRAHADRGGSIVAAVDSDVLFPGRESYAYCWPRDGALIADSLARAGDHATATRFFRWVAGLERHGGALLQRYHPDGSVASGWMQTLRAGQEVLPVQADETALVLLKCAQHCARIGSAALGGDDMTCFVQDSARFLLRHRGPTGLPRASVDLWEETFAIHSATLAVTAMALQNLALLSALVRDDALIAEAADAAANMKAAFQDLLGHELVPPRNWPESADGTPCREGADRRVDVSLLWLQIEGLLHPRDARADAIRRAVGARLRVESAFGGFARYEGDTYLRTPECSSGIAGNPWPLAAFMLARASAEAGELEGAREALRLGLCTQSPAGHLPEQHHPFTGAPMGVMPLAWAHAAHLDALGALARSSSARI